jgi:predicted ATPase/class 3 adenylate cyclase
MTTREQIEHAIAALEKQRAALGESAAETALAELRARLKSMEATLPRTGERRSVTVMFADISGFTAMSEKLDPESMRALINETFERLVPFIEQNGGTVEKFIGDEIMAIFGAPVAHENDAERAVRTALAIMEALNAFNAERNLNLGIHIGINTGPVIAGMLGTRKHQQYGVLGDTVNLAARLEDASERGQIFVGPDTYRLTAPLFDFRTLEPIRVKGKSQPVPIHQVTGAKIRPGSVRGLELSGIRSELIGRADQLSALIQSVERAAQGKGAIVGVLGEAGLGKSRLVAEARHASTQIPARWIEGRTLSFGQTISHWPFREIIRQAAGIAEEDREDAAWDKLKIFSGALLADEHAEALPFLASLLALPIQPDYRERLQYLDADALGRQIFLSVRRVIEQMALAHPLVLILEDLHWADQSSVDLLQYILPLVRTAPLLIVIPTRPEFQTPGGRLLGWLMQEYREDFTGLWLEPLSENQSAQLLHNLIAIESLPVRVRAMILDKAEGNPFYVEEVVRALIALNVLTRDPAAGKWQVTAQVDQVTIPDTIQGIIMARVDQLDEGLKEALRTAAVIGRTFPYRILRALNETDARLGEQLDELRQLELIREKSRTPELVFIFKHALTRDAIYESILLQKRRELHARIGQTIESVFPDRLEPFYSLLAHHFAQAEDWEKVQEYLLKAGDQASHMAADAEALAHYRQAIEVYGRMRGEKWDALDRAKLELKMAEAYFRRGEYSQASETLQRVLAVTGGVMPEALSAIRRGLIVEAARQFAHWLMPRLFLRPLGRLTEAALKLRGRALELIAWIDVWNIPERAALDTIMLLNLAERNGADELEQIGAAGLGYMCASQGLHRLSKGYSERAIRLAEKGKQPAGLAHAYNMAAAALMIAGKWEACMENYRRAIKYYEITGNMRGKGLALTAYAIARRARSEYALSMELAKQILELGRNGADAQVYSWGIHGRGTIGWFNGSLPEEEAIGLINEAIGMYERMPDYSGMATALGNLGACYLQQGKLKKALQVLEQGKTLIAEHGVRAINATPVYNALADAYLSAAEKEENNAEKNRWMARARAACAQAARHSGIDRGGLPEAQYLQGRYAWLRGDKSAARRWWKRSLESAKRNGQPYDMAITYLEMGRRMNRQDCLLQAEVLFTKIGALRMLGKMM